MLGEVRKEKSVLDGGVGLLSDNGARLTWRIKRRKEKGDLLLCTQPILSEGRVGSTRGEDGGEADAEERTLEAVTQSDRSYATRTEKKRKSPATQRENMVPFAKRKYPPRPRVRKRLSISFFGGKGLGERIPFQGHHKGSSSSFVLLKGGFLPPHPPSARQTLPAFLPPPPFSLSISGASRR